MVTGSTRRGGDEYRAPAIMTCAARATTSLPLCACSSWMNALSGRGFAQPPGLCRYRMTAAGMAWARVLLMQAMACHIGVVAGPAEAERSDGVDGGGDGVGLGADVAVIGWPIGCVCGATTAGPRR
jgi:hypothetical protein